MSSAQGEGGRDQHTPLSCHGPDCVKTKSRSKFAMPVIGIEESALSREVLY
jgi:hypothetical protein